MRRTNPLTDEEAADPRIRKLLDDQDDLLYASPKRESLSEEERQAELGRLEALIEGRRAGMAAAGVVVPGPGPGRKKTPRPRAEDPTVPVPAPEASVCPGRAPSDRDILGELRRCRAKLVALAAAKKEWVAAHQARVVRLEKRIGELYELSEGPPKQPGLFGELPFDEDDAEGGGS